MAFKVDASFLRFLTMGALGARRVMQELEARGFQPIEFERYSTSNKIWATKIKRLRVPDLLCVRTGLRVEVRAKTDLKIKMSDAPANPERVWDAGLRGEDIVALVACHEGDDGPVPAEHAVYFTVRALRRSATLSRLGQPKSASEGAERDREWPCTVPTRSGTVLGLGAGKLKVLMDADHRPARRQTYTLGNKRAYVVPGERFVAGSSILAGVPASLADLDSRLGDQYAPVGDLGARSPIARLAAAKALPARPDLRNDARIALDRMLAQESHPRVALEAAASAAALGSASGEDLIASKLLPGAAERDMAMEAIFILSSLDTDFARQRLLDVAAMGAPPGDERRQAAIWGLGKVGHRAYGELVRFIADGDRDAALHAIAAFGSDTPKPVIDAITEILVRQDPVRAAAASEVLRCIANADVVQSLLSTAGSTPSAWVLATLGRLPPALVRDHLRGNPLLARLEPMLLTAQDSHWLFRESTASDLSFLLKQTL